MWQVWRLLLFDLQKLQPSLPRFGRMFLLMHVVHLTDPSSSIGISMRYSLHRIIRSLFFWDEIVKQQRVTWITMNDLDTTAPVTTVERKRQQRFLRAWQKFPTAVVLKIKVLARCRLQLCCTAGWIDFMLTFCIAICVWWGQLKMRDWKIKHKNAGGEKCETGK